MMDRQRRNEILRKLVAAVALIACLAIGLAMVNLITSGGLQTKKTPPPSVTTRTLAPPPENLRPLQIRPVQEMRSPDECPPEGQIPAVPPSEILTTCDFMRTATYVLAPQTIELQLTHVDSRKSPTSEFYLVRLTMDAASRRTFAGYTAQHVGGQLAFIRDDVVIFAPKIAQPIDSDGLEISGDMTAQQADGMLQLLRKPA